MIVLSKKRILIISSFIFISLFAFIAQTNTNKSNVVETMALPVSNKVIVIDAGHGKPDEGAQSSNRNNRS